MTGGRPLFLLLSAWLATGIGLAAWLSPVLLLSPMSRVLWGLLLLSALLSLWAFGLLRRGWAGLGALALCFVLLGFLRSLLPSLSLLPSSLGAWGASVSYGLSLRMEHLGLTDWACSLVQAMLLGQRSALTPETRELYRQSGAAHILALSGLHLGILSGLLTYGLMRLLHTRWRHAVGLAGLLLMWAYALVTGFPVSLCRAALMLSLFVVAQMRLVGSNGWHALGLSAFLLLMLDPGNLLDIGFQLSFLSVAGILLLYRPLAELWIPRHALLRWLYRAWAVSLAAQLFTFPLSLCYFRYLSLSGVLLSPVFVLLATAIVYSALLLLLLPPFVVALLRPMVEAFVGTQHGLMALSGYGVGDVRLSAPAVVLCYAALLCLLPLLVSLGWNGARPSGHRLAVFFRNWPRLLAALLLLLVAFFLL